MRVLRLNDTPIFYLPAGFSRSDDGGARGFLSSAVYLLASKGECAAVDAGRGENRLFAVARWLDRRGCDLAWLCLTHHHHDHVANADSLRSVFGARVMAHFEEKPLIESPFSRFDEARIRDQYGTTLRCTYRERNFSDEQYRRLKRRFRENRCFPAPVDEILEDGQVLEVGDTRVEVHHTPGHTPGSVSLYVPGLEALFAGDVPFWLGPAEVYPLAGYAQWRQSLEDILSLEPAILAWGHGLAVQGKDRVAGFVRRILGRSEMLQQEVLRMLRKRPQRVDCLTEKLGREVGGDIVESGENLLGATIHAMLREAEARGEVRGFSRDGQFLWTASG